MQQLCADTDLKTNILSNDTVALNRTSKDTRRIHYSDSPLTAPQEGHAVVSHLLIKLVDHPNNP